jgi:anthranilate synthase component 1
MKNNVPYDHVYAGIVADSVPNSEWMETLNKARAVLRACPAASYGAGGSR